jgi:hypothetical protein
MLLKDDSGNSIKLSKDDCLKLELKLNTSEYGNQWRNIGDQLYNFYIGKINDEQYIVTPYQFAFLMDLIKPHPD